MMMGMGGSVPPPQAEPIKKIEMSEKEQRRITFHLYWRGYKPYLMDMNRRSVIGWAREQERVTGLVALGMKYGPDKIRQMEFTKATVFCKGDLIVLAEEDQPTLA